MAILSCRIGVSHLEDIEDAVQSALLGALETWPIQGLPDNPSAWLFRVAQNRVLGELRQRSNRRRILEERVFKDEPLVTEEEATFGENEIRDDLLRMLFVCCDESIPQESQLVLALKTLCGFDVREIADRLFTSEANVYKRLGRARTQLRSGGIELLEIPSDCYPKRRPAVLQTLYLLFTEGYFSSHSELVIRRELCDEAIRLSRIMAEHPVGQGPDCYALLALMHFQVARIESRCGAAGELLLLEEQDRKQWDCDLIKQGMSWLAQSAEGSDFTRFHAEAGVAAEHCLASSFEETRWDRIVACYELLEQISPSPLHRLNRAVAMAEWQGAHQGLEILDGWEPPSWLLGSYQWLAVLADLHRRCERKESSKRYRKLALEAAPNSAVRELLQRRLYGKTRALRT